MKTNSSVTMLRRLGELSKRLEFGEHISEEDVVNEYETSERTAYRDFTEKLPELLGCPLEKNKSTQKWFTPQSTKSLFLTQEEELVLNMLIEQSKNNGQDFFNGTMKLIDKFKDSLHTNSIYTKVDVEDIQDIKEDMLKIEQAIVDRKVIECTYKNKQRIVKPLKLASFDGYWYVVIKDIKDDVIKTYYFKDVHDVVVTNETFSDICEDLQKRLDCAINAYFEGDGKCYPVQLYVESKIAYLFHRKKISNSQRIVKEYDDGSLDIEVHITNDMEIIPIVQRYLPYMKVIEPENIWQHVLENITNCED